MAVTHSTAARTVLADAAVDLVDVGGAGTIEFLTSGDVHVATVTLSNPGFGAAASGVATMSGAPKVSAAASAGTIAKAEIRNNGGTAVILCACGTSGSDINIPGGLTLAASDTVTITALTYTAPL
jgi:hypothetical protein